MNPVLMRGIVFPKIFDTQGVSTIFERGGVQYLLFPYKKVIRFKKGAGSNGLIGGGEGGSSTLVSLGRQSLHT